MKAGIIYTATTPDAVRAINAEISNRFDDSLEIISYQDAPILDEIREKGCVTAKAASRLVTMFMQAVMDEVDAILCCCSSVGEVAAACQKLASCIGVPIIMIDEEMCREAVRLGEKIGILATLPTTMEPTGRTLMLAAHEMDCRITLVDGLVDGAFGLERNELETLICNKVSEIIDKVDVILLAQASMAWLEKPLAEKFKKPVLSSPRFGVAALADALGRNRNVMTQPVGKGERQYED